MLEAIDLRCERGERTLFDRLEFKLPRGALLRVAGANGSGKTSLLRILCGLALPAGGAVRWHGESIRTLREEYHRQLIYIGHLPAVKDELTGRENLAVSCALGGVHADAAAVDAALDRVGLDAYADLPARHLSQGQRRRVALARLAACRATPLWILDEPFTALDTAAVGCVGEMIAEHLEAGGIAVFTSHQEVRVASADVYTIELGG
jgi:heme exporter protein A